MSRVKIRRPLSQLTSRVAEEFLRRSVYYRSGMRIRQVRVSLHHAQRPMPEYRGNLRRRGAAHGQVARGGVP